MESSQTVSLVAASAEAGLSDKVMVIKVEDTDVSLDLLTGPFVEDDTNSGIYPYNALVHPFTHLKRLDNI
jgi:ATP-dependent helicase STH1/SNF2